MNKVLLIILSFFYSIAAAQVPIGSWQEHIAVNDVFQVQNSGGKIFAFARNGYFVIDSEEELMIKYTKLNKLSDADISAAILLPDDERIIIGYANGNIDIIENGNCINIPDLKLKQLTGSKTINNISIVNNLAFCSTDFGILVVDYNKYEIKDTYYIGDNAAEIKVNQICTYESSVFAATEVGVLSAPIDSPLVFYEMWENIYPSNNFIDITSYESGVLAVRNSSGTFYEEINEDNNWISRKIEASFVKYQQSKQSIYSIFSDSIQVMDNRLQLAGTYTKYQLENSNANLNFSSIIDIEGGVWFGDATLGLIEKREPYDLQYLPNGPSTNRTFRIAAASGIVYAVPGITQQTDNTPLYPAELSIFEHNYWTRINKYTHSILEDVYNFCDLSIDPKNSAHVYIASRNGLFELANDQLIHYTDLNSPIVEVYGLNLINGLAIDSDGNLFCNNQSFENPTLIKAATAEDDGVWYSYNYYNFIESDAGSPRYRSMLYSSHGYLWIVGTYRNSGLYVVDFNNTLEKGNDDVIKGPIPDSESIDSRSEYLEIWDEDGAVIDVTPSSFCEDKDGYIWIGTNSGVLVYYRPNRIFEEDKPVASRIKISRDDGSDLADYLLDNVAITSIVVDGANRKWIGTETDGVYCVSPDGVSTIYHFTTDNSPLLSNYITTIAIDPSSGMVYFGTNNGIVSYQNEANEGKETFSDVYAFPNPVQPGYEGVITIANLMDDSTIRITDISGKVVYQGISLGGRLIWNGRNIYNDKVKSGVYIVYATNEDGSESVATKIMIIN